MFEHLAGGSRGSRAACLLACLMPACTALQLTPLAMCNPSTQVREITRSLKEREARAREAEDVAADHLAREKRLLQNEAAVRDREAAADAAAEAAEARQRELEGAVAAQRQEMARLEAGAAALEEREAAVSAALEGREAALAAREHELAAGVAQFEDERAAAAAADEQDRQRAQGELRRLGAAVEEAVDQMRAAEAEATEQRDRLLAVQRDTAEAEAARDAALLAHKAAQQVGGVARGVAMMRACASVAKPCCLRLPLPASAPAAALADVLRPC